MVQLRRLAYNKLLNVCHSTYSDGRMMSKYFKTILYRYHVSFSEYLFVFVSCILHHLFSTYDLQFKSMKQDLPTQITFCLNNKLIITTAITNLTITIATVYFAGSHLGYLFAQFILRFMQPTQSQYQNTGSIQHKDTMDISKNM